MDKMNIIKHIVFNNIISDNVLVYLLCLYIDTQWDYTKLERMTKCYKNIISLLPNQNFSKILCFPQIRKDIIIIILSLAIKIQS